MFWIRLSILQNLARHITKDSRNCKHLVTQASTRGVLLKKLFSKSLQSSQENICVGVSFLTKLQVSGQTFVTEHLWATAYVVKGAVLLQAVGLPVDTERKLNVHKTFRRRPGRLLNVLCSFNLHPVSMGLIFTKKHWLYLKPLSQSNSVSGYRSSRPEVFFKKGVLRNFTKFTRKHLCQSLFFFCVCSPSRNRELQWVTVFTEAVARDVL